MEILAPEVAVIPAARRIPGAVRIADDRSGAGSPEPRATATSPDRKMTLQSSSDRVRKLPSDHDRP
jgi:hypothetical protein